MKKLTYLLLDDDGPLAIVKASDSRVCQTLHRWPREGRIRLIGARIEVLRDNIGLEFMPLIVDQAHHALGYYIQLGEAPGHMRTMLLVNYLADVHELTL